MEYMPPWGTKKSPCPSSALVSPHMGRDGSGNSSQLSPLSQPYCPTPTMPLSPNSTAYGYNTSTPYYTTSMNIAPVRLPSLKSSTSLTRFGDYYLISSVQGENDIFRAMKRSTGSRVLLYRVHTACLDHAVVERVAKTWRWIRHPNIIPLQNMVLTSALSHTSSSSVNSPSGLEVIAEYRYIPKLKSFEKILQSSKGSSSSPPPFNSNSAPTSDPPNAFVNSNTPLVSESNVWSIAVQLLSAVQHVHACHAVVRGINSQSVCLGPWGRVYITKIGIMDLQLFLSSGTALNTGAPSENSIKNFTSSTDVNALQKRDLADVGQLLLTICCAQQSTTSLEYFLSLAYYTQALKNFVLALIPNPRDLDEVHDLESLCRRRTVSSSPTTTTIQHIGSNSTETKICTSESDPGIKDTNEPSSWLNNMQVKSNLTLGHEKLAHELDGLTTEEHANRNTSSFLRNYDRKVFVKAEHALQVLMNRILDELAAATNHLNNVVINEEHNIHGGRALRVLTKLNFILDRQDQEKDSRWNETNPRYLLRLFRSYVFHQIDSQGVPSLDWGHVMTCLHKLDIGSEERILLMSKDEHILTVTSYLTLRDTLDEVFNELLQGSASKSVSFPWYKG